MSNVNFNPKEFVIARYHPIFGELHNYIKLKEYYAGMSSVADGKGYIKNWVKDAKDAAKFDNPMLPRRAIRWLNLEEETAWVEALPQTINSIIKENTEMNEKTIIQSLFHFKGRRVYMYVRHCGTDGNIKYTKNKKEAMRFPNIESAENFVKLYKPHNPQIIYVGRHDDSLDALRYCYTRADVDATTELMKEYFNMEREMAMILPEIKNVIFNNPATIVFWDDEDKTKTVVKCQEGETYDPEKGLAMAIAKKALGNNYNYYNTIKHWLKKAPKVETSRFYCNGVEYTKTVKADK